MKKLAVLSLLVLLAGCGEKYIKVGTDYCPVKAPPVYQKQSNATDGHIADRENIAILGNNINMLTAWAEGMYNGTIKQCYEKQVTPKN